MPPISDFVGNEIPVSEMVPELLASNLKAKGYTRGRKIKGDGDCFYRALGYSLVSKWTEDTNVDKFKLLSTLLNTPVKLKFPDSWKNPLTLFKTFVQARTQGKWSEPWEWNNVTNDYGLVYAMKYIGIVEFETENIPGMQLPSNILQDKAWAEDEITQFIPNALKVRVNLLRVKDLTTLENTNKLGPEDEPIEADLLYHDRTHFDMLVPNLKVQVQRQQEYADKMVGLGECKDRGPKHAGLAHPNFDPAQCFGEIKEGVDGNLYEAIHTGGPKGKYKWNPLVTVDGKSRFNKEEYDEDGNPIGYVKLPCEKDNTLTTYVEWPKFDPAKCIGQTRANDKGITYISKRSLSSGPKWYPVK